MWAFIAGFMSIPYVLSAMGLYFWLTSGLDYGNFIRGTAIGGAFLVMATVILLSLVRIK